DTSIFIYFIEDHPRYRSFVRPLFAHIDDGGLAAVTSVLTLLETLVVPYRCGDRELASKYEAILTNGRGLTVIPIDHSLVRLAAEIRATTSVGTADALQLATALATRCSAFLTNDHRLPPVGGLKVLQLDEFAPVL